MNTQKIPHECKIFNENFNNKLKLFSKLCKYPHIMLTKLDSENNLIWTIKAATDYICHGKIKIKVK